ncbi:hypothetical protein HBI46_212260 [Parastagonospora nodorum]|nr:hypothetical protein HBH97_093130 [Parastagonospora nodorum]KAH4791722.1 hypothetical protein HBH63_099280 [Parastagonospora nodorum]KAH4961069.1 hypothetical protein HBI78_149260 [Parastagonospora nodorum]KAH5013167.1 hypothetical protein HBI77_076360 [Parastagonospora nodorum]KAH5083362.1 hypothetical protein HBH95_048580 [Parastagonospora nodorum]
MLANVYPPIMNPSLSVELRSRLPQSTPSIAPFRATAIVIATEVNDDTTVLMSREKDQSRFTTPQVS